MTLLLQNGLHPLCAVEMCQTVALALGYTFAYYSAMNLVARRFNSGWSFICQVAVDQLSQDKSHCALQWTDI